MAFSRTLLTKSSFDSKGKVGSRTTSLKWSPTSRIWFLLHYPDRGRDYSQSWNTKIVLSQPGQFHFYWRTNKSHANDLKSLIYLDLDSELDVSSRLTKIAWTLRNWLPHGVCFNRASVGQICNSNPRIKLPNSIVEKRRISCESGMTCRRKCLGEQIVQMLQTAKFKGWNVAFRSSCCILMSISQSNILY